MALVFDLCFSRMDAAETNSSAFICAQGTRRTICFCSLACLGHRTRRRRGSVRAQTALAWNAGLIYDNSNKP